jgi:hypothetical protein
VSGTTRGKIGSVNSLTLAISVSLAAVAAPQIAAADFFTTEVWTWRGLVTFYTVVVIDLALRRVRIVARRRIPTRRLCAK